MDWEEFFEKLKKAHLKGRRQNSEGAIVYKPRIFLRVENAKTSAAGYIFEVKIYDVREKEISFSYNLYNLPPVEIPYERVAGVSIEWQKEIYETRRVPRQIKSEKFKIKNHEIKKITITVDGSELNFQLPT